MKTIQSAEAIKENIEDIVGELNELDADQHPRFYRNEPKGREREAFLLSKLNATEEKLAKIRG